MSNTILVEEANTSHAEPDGVEQFPKWARPRSTGFGAAVEVGERVVGPRHEFRQRVRKKCACQVRPA